MCTLPKPPAGRALSEGKEAPRLHSQAGASPPRLSAARRESGSRCPWLREAAPQPECCSVCAQKAPARPGLPWSCPVGDNRTLIKFPIHNKGERFPSSVQKFSNRNNNRLHPTQKPVALCEYLIKTYTNEGETVLDNCMGSGTTGVACVNTDRNFIGIELDDHYFEVATERINQAQLSKSSQ